MNSIEREPYFMSNPEWYKIIGSHLKYEIVLTDKAPEKAVESYNEYKKEVSKWQSVK